MNCIGTDVKVLTSLLLKHGFIAKGDIKTNDAGYVIFNAAVMEGVKKFQKAVSLPVTGIADSKTMEKLKQYGK